MDASNRCSLIQLKKKNRLRKEINKLLSKGMSNITQTLLLRKTDILKTPIF